jgi:drug/metabolite transporter (DMT)-like permease
MISLLSGNSLTGYSLEGYFWVVVITLSLQIVTHGSINLALRYFSATYVSISLQTSVIGNVLFASLFFDEVPKELQLVGAATIVIGVILASIGRGQARIATAQNELMKSRNT